MSAFVILHPYAHPIHSVLMPPASFTLTLCVCVCVCVCVAPGAGLTWQETALLSLSHLSLLLWRNSLHKARHFSLLSLCAFTAGLHSPSLALPFSSPSLSLSQHRCQDCACLPTLPVGVLQHPLLPTATVEKQAQESEMERKKERKKERKRASGEKRPLKLISTVRGWAIRSGES